MVCYKNKTSYVSLYGDMEDKLTFKNCNNKVHMDGWVHIGNLYVINSNICLYKDSSSNFKNLLLINSVVYLATPCFGHNVRIILYNSKVIWETHYRLIKLNYKTENSKVLSGKLLNKKAFYSIKITY